jgi:hypothetical protein
MGLSFTIAAGPRQRRGLMTTFHCLRFETPPNCRARYPYLYPPETGCPDYTPRHWVPFSSPPSTLRATVEVFDPASTRDRSILLQFCFRYVASGRTQQKTPLFCCCLRNVCYDHAMVTECSPNSAIACLPCRNLATDIHDSGV